MTFIIVPDISQNQNKISQEMSIRELFLENRVWGYTPISLIFSYIKDNPYTLAFQVMNYLASLTDREARQVSCMSISVLFLYALITQNIS